MAYGSTESGDSMILMLDLPADLEHYLAAEAAGLNLSLPEYVFRLLVEHRTPRAQPRNGAELVAYWESEGLFGTRPDIADSPSHARALREQAQQRDDS